MKIPIPALFCLILCVLLVGCPVAIETKSIVSIGTIGEAPKLDYPKIESLLADISAMLKSSGFRGYDEMQPYGYHLTGERIYTVGFSMESTIGCSVKFDRKSAQVRFYESESPPKSHVFPATDEQRRTVRMLARRIESYLRSHLPPSYQIRVSTDERNASAET